MSTAVSAGSSTHTGKEKEPQQQKQIKFRTNFRNTIYDVLVVRGWKETFDTDWDFVWGDKYWVAEGFNNVPVWHDHMRANHFRNHWELTRKDLLIKNLKRMKKQLEREGKPQEAAKYAFFPPSYVLPKEYPLFIEEFKRNPGTVWIMKPIARSQGKGIFLFNKLSQISEWRNTYLLNNSSPRGNASPNSTGNGNEATQAEAYVVQRYIDNPYTIGGKKFDLRIYALVTSYSPQLVVYLYRTGFARFSNHRFSMKEIHNNYIHLTNVAVQKTSDLHDANHGCKWMVGNVKRYMIARHGEDKVKKCFADIQSVIVHALLSVQKVMITDRHCFELYGYDIIIDKNLKPWLLEVNAAPSMTADTPEDYQLKFNMLNDMLDIVDMEKKLTGEEKQIGGFDLIYNGGPFKADLSCGYSTFLGCYNYREEDSTPLIHLQRRKKNPPPPPPKRQKEPEDEQDV